ncbi:hypothetical protein GHT06_001544 [Daphnia sinensis]|uniref:THAP-type domain-containing protein n=1 Tax=Daphnia sinensis TaxID=1820382 RepID=A0AAD5PL39_9CRUS|nr:hypothetical protein GHT06_001544 [Daphnia sinensis]
MPVIITLLFVSLLEIFCYPCVVCTSSLVSLCRVVVFKFEMPVRCALQKCSSMSGSLTVSKTGENNIGLMDGQHLTSKCKVCELHFAESDIIKGKTVKKDGRNSFILHKYWILKASAVPVRLCGSSPTSDVDEHLSPQASEGTTNNSVIAVKELTCRFVQLGGTNIINSTIQQNIILAGRLFTLVDRCCLLSDRLGIEILWSLSFLPNTITITHRDRIAITLVIFNCTAEHISLDPNGCGNAAARTEWPGSPKRSCLVSRLLFVRIPYPWIEPTRTSS